MIITEKTDKEQKKFEEILSKTHFIINEESIKNPSTFYDKNASQENMEFKISD